MIDGVSTYKLDSDGMIYEHMVDNVQLRDPPITNPLMYALNYILTPRLAGQPGQVPCPGSWFSGSSEVAMSVVEEVETRAVVAAVAVVPSMRSLDDLPEPHLAGMP